MWRHRFGSTLAFNGLLPDHTKDYLNQCWHMEIDSKSLGRCSCNLDCVILKHISVTNIWVISCGTALNTLRPRQNGRHFPDDIFKWIFLNENVWISINISPKFVPRGPINNIPTLVQVMAWLRPSDKPLSEPMMVRLLMHICVTRPQLVKWMSQDLADNVSILFQVMAWCGRL